MRTHAAPTVPRPTLPIEYETDRRRRLEARALKIGVRRNAGSLLRLSTAQLIEELLVADPGLAGWVMPGGDRAR